MTDPAPGTAPAPQPAPSGAATPPQQPQAPTPAPGTPPAQAQPSVEELQTKLAAETKAREVAENSAKHFQSQFDQVRTRAAAIAQPQQPPEDPLAPFVSKLTGQGYNETDARNLLQVTQEMIRPIQEQLQQANAALRSTTQVDTALNAAYQADPDLFRDSKVVDYVRAELQAAAVSPKGHEYVNPQYATACAQAEWARLNTPWKQQALPPGNPTPPPPQNGLRPLNFGGAQPGFTPAAPVTKQANPMTEQIYAQMAAHANVPKQT